MSKSLDFSVSLLLNGDWDSSSEEALVLPRTPATVDDTNHPKSHGKVHSVDFKNSAKHEGLGILWVIPHFTEKCRNWRSLVSPAVDLGLKLDVSKRSYLGDRNLHLSVEPNFKITKFCEATILYNGIKSVMRVVERDDARVQFHLTVAGDFLDRGITLPDTLTVYLKLNAPDPDTMILPNPVLSNMMETGVMSDVECVTGDARFPCHKAVLASVSAEFKAMFALDTKKKRSKVVDFSGILDKDVLADLVSYIYTESTPNMKSSHKQLLVAGETYELDNLQSMCNLHIALEELRLSNAMEYLQFAVANGLEWLKDFCVDFAVNNFREIRKTEGYQTAPPEIKSLLL